GEAAHAVLDDQVDAVDEGDEQAQAGVRQASREVRQRQDEAAGRADEALQVAQDQPARRLLAAPAADADLVRAVPDAVGGGGALPRAVRGLDPGPDGAGSLLRDPDRPDRRHVPPDQAVAGGGGLAAAEDHAVPHAGDARLLLAGVSVG